MKNEKGLFGLSLPLQFLIYYVISFVMFFGGAFVLGINAKPQHILIGSLVISAFTAICMTGMILSADVSERFFKKVEALDKEAREATTISELNNVRDRVIQLHIKEAFGGRYNATIKVRDFIDTRLKYEFKV